MTFRHAIYARQIRPLRPIPSGLTPDVSGIQPYAAMLFDVYGTLLVSGAGETGVNRSPHLTVHGLTELLQRFSIRRSAPQLVNDLNSAIEKVHRIRRRQGIDFPEVDIVNVWSGVLGFDERSRIEDFALEFEMIVNPVYGMPGAKELLSACKRANMVAGIISNAQFYTILLLEQFFGPDFGAQGFTQDLLFFSWREGAAKPSPVMFDRAREALAGMGIPADDVLYVGNDMRKDILPAASAGFKTALFAGDRRSLRQRADDGRCRNLSPDLTVTDLRQLIAGTGIGLGTK